MVPGRVRVAAVVALLAVPALGGCTGSGTPEGVPVTASSGSSPSVAASGTPGASGPSAAAASESEAPAPPKAGRGPAGQKAFARFVMDAWSWALRTNDPSPLLDVSPSRRQPCDGCRALTRELAGRAKQGWYVDFPGLDVERTRLRRAGDTVVARSQVSIPASDSYNDDGSYRSTSPAHPDTTFTVTMRSTRSGYRLVSFRVG